MIRIQERDKYFLTKIGEYGIINNKTMNRMYGTVQYSIRRRKRLADEKYIIKNNLYCSLGVKGRKYLMDELGMEYIRDVSTDRYPRIRIGKISEILTALEKNYFVYPSWKLKNTEVLNERKDKYYGKIVSRYNGKKYYIYNLGRININTKYVINAINLKKRYARDIRDEILSKAENGKIERTIIMAEDRRTMDIYNGNLMPLNVKEQLVIPWGKIGFELINMIGIEDINGKAMEYLYGTDYTAPEWIYADYTAEGKQIMVLVTNDVEKIVKIKQIQMATRYNLANKMNMVIVCMESQYGKFRKEFKNMEIRTVPDRIIWKN